jgi:hypothetical protein
MGLAVIKKAEKHAALMRATIIKEERNIIDLLSVA